MQTDIRDRLLATRLPAMPHVLLKLLALCHREDAGIADIAEVVAKDAGICGRIMSVANSAAFARNGKCPSLERALMTLGGDTIRSLVIGESVAQVFSHFSRQCPVELSSFWRHSLTTAVIAKEMAKAVSYSHTEEAYLAGLLHDVGRLALVCACPKEYGAFFPAPESDANCDLEKTWLQITHAEAGAWLIERWRLDSFLADSVLYHHQPISQVENLPTLVRLLLVANRLAEFGPNSQQVDEAALLLSLPAESLNDIAERAESLVKQAAEQLGIDLKAEADTQSATDHSGNSALAEEVRQLLTTTEAIRPVWMHHDDQEVLRTLVRSAHILFAFEQAAILSYDPAKNILVGVPLDKEHQRLGEISLPLASGTPMSDALLRNDPLFLDLDDPALSVAEKQLLRLLEATTAVCLPLPGTPCAIGILIGVTRPAQRDALKKRPALLQSFATQGARAIESARQHKASVSERVDGVIDAYGDAAKRMVHEANNPLAIIKNYLGILDNKLKSQQPVDSEISILNEEIDRVGKILLAFSTKRPANDDQRADINRIARDVVRLFENTGFAPASVRISARTGDAPLNIPGDANLARQILINLVKNAIEAMPEGGDITIAADGLINFGGRMCVDLSVRDTGPGIPDGLLKSVFGPIKSNKEGENRGLGLRIVNELVEKLGGQVICSSGQDGTRFSVLLPAL